MPGGYVDTQCGDGMVESAITWQRTDGTLVAVAPMVHGALPVDVAVWKGPGLFDRTLCELGGGEMTEPEAVQVLARDIARDVLSGTLEPSQATGSAASIYVRTGYRFDSFHQLYVLDEEMSYFDKRDRSYLGRSRDAVENDVRSEAKRLLKSPSDP